MIHLTTVSIGSVKNRPYIQMVVLFMMIIVSIIFRKSKTISEDDSGADNFENGMNISELQYSRVLVIQALMYKLAFMMRTLYYYCTTTILIQVKIKTQHQY
jgi:uncharacterized membrane protein YjgN (DUF898 family)